MSRTLKTPRGPGGRQPPAGVGGCPRFCCCWFCRLKSGGGWRPSRTRWVPPAGWKFGSAYAVSSGGTHGFARAGLGARDSTRDSNNAGPLQLRDCHLVPGGAKTGRTAERLRQFDSRHDGTGTGANSALLTPRCWQAFTMHCTRMARASAVCWRATCCGPCPRSATDSRVEQVEMVDRFPCSSRPNCLVPSLLQDRLPLSRFAIFRHLHPNTRTRHMLSGEWPVLALQPSLRVTAW